MQKNTEFNLSNLDEDPKSYYNIHDTTTTKSSSRLPTKSYYNIHDTTTTKSSSRLPKLVVACKDDDVLLGRGRVGWIGNQRFQKEARRNAQRYVDCHSRYEKARIVLEIIGTVQAWGGRFLCKPRPSAMVAAIETTASASTQRKGSQPTFAIAPLGTVRKKVGQALRYQLELLKGEPSDTRKIIDLESNRKPLSCGEKNDALGSPSMQPQHHATDYTGSCSFCSSSSTETSIEDGRGEESQKVTAIGDGNDSVWSWDLSAAAAAALELSDDSCCGLHCEQRPPLLSDYDILQSLGYDLDAIQAATDTTVNSDRPIFISEEELSSLTEGGNDNHHIDDSILPIRNWLNDNDFGGSLQLSAFGTGGFASGMTNNGSFGTEIKLEDEDGDDIQNNPTCGRDYEAHRGWRQDMA